MVSSWWMCWGNFCEKFARPHDAWQSSVFGATALLRERTVLPACLEIHGVGKGKGSNTWKVPTCNDRPLFDPPEMLNAPLTKLYLQVLSLTFHGIGKTMVVMNCCWYRQIAFV